MVRALFEKEVYIRFADEPVAFVYTVKYGGFTVKAARIPISRWGPQTADVDGQFEDTSNTVKQLLRKPTPGNSGRSG
jgi:hypothetical protein